MILKTFRFISLICISLAFGLTLTHVLEIPGKRQLSSDAWLTVQHTFYGGFAIVGGIAEVLGLLSTIAILIMTWKHPKILYLMLVTVASFLGMLLTYAFGNRPINDKISQWTTTTIPYDWHTYRDQWDFFHSLTACFAAIALVCLLISVLRDNHLERY